MVKRTADVLADLQSGSDSRMIELSSVGVSDIRLPIEVLDPARGSRDTVADIRMSVDVPADARGAHLSRFLELLNGYQGRLTLTEVSRLLTQLRELQGSRSAAVEVAFDYFISKAAPASGAVGLMDYRCAFLGRDVDGQQDLCLRVTVPVATLCPCSKEISDEGAHNQRSEVTVDLRSEGIVWIEEVIEWVESSASSPLYPVLKRVDEKYVTEHAYANPRFVEDLIREVILRARADARVRWIHASARSFESIHNHNAFAEATWESGATQSCRMSES